MFDRAIAGVKALAVIPFLGASVVGFLFLFLLAVVWLILPLLGLLAATIDFIKTFHIQIALLAITILAVGAKLKSMERNRGRMGALEFVATAILLIRKEELPLPSPEQFVAWMEALITDPEKYEKPFQSPFFNREIVSRSYAKGFNESVEHLWRYAVSLRENEENEFDFHLIESYIIHMTHHFNAAELPPFEVSEPPPSPKPLRPEPGSGNFRIEEYMKAARDEKWEAEWNSEDPEVTPDPQRLEGCLYCGRPITI